MEADVHYTYTADSDSDMGNRDLVGRIGDVQTKCLAVRLG